MKSAWTEPVAAEIVAGIASCLTPNSDALVGMLPHRPPFRFVDRSTPSPSPSTSRRAGFVTGDEYFLKGHFPGNPIVPGVIQLEALAQAGAITLAGRRALRGEARAVRWRREGAVPSGRAPGRRAAAGGRRRAAQRARGLGAGPRVGRRRDRRARRGCSSRSADAQPSGRVGGFGGSLSSARSLRSPPRASSSESSLGTAPDPRHLAGRLVGVAVEEQLGLDGLVERVAPAAPAATGPR